MMGEFFGYGPGDEESNSETSEPGTSSDDQGWVDNNWGSDGNSDDDE